VQAVDLIFCIHC